MTSITSDELNNLHTNQKLVVSELINRGASVKVINPVIELIEVEYQGKKDFLLDRFSSAAPFHVVKLTADKWRTKTILHAANINVPAGAIFNFQQIEEVMDFLDCAQYPLVFKPNWGSHGDGVVANLVNKEQASATIWQYIAENDPNSHFILEDYYPWPEHRVFATQTGGFAVIHREQASVTGDGNNSLATLIEIENSNRRVHRANNPSSACEITLDSELKRYLSQNGLDLNFVPRKGYKVQLRYTSNLAKGGRAVDKTDLAHPSIKHLAKRVLDAFPYIPCVGIDLLCSDIESELSDANHVIIEVNSNPGLAMHVYPTEGISRPVHKDIVDVMFPWIPSIAT